jgi:hypothetical protein
MKTKIFQIKSLLLSIVLVAMVTGLASAQNIRFNAYAAYVFDDKVDSYYSNTDYYDGKIEGGFQWGGGLEFMASPTKGIELKYLRQDTKAPMEYYSFDNNRVMNTEFDLAINYVLLGGTNYFKGVGNKVEPYGGLEIGMAIFDIENPDTGKSEGSTKFAWGFKLGTNIWASEKVGIKLQGELLSAVQSAGGGVYFGTGGAGAGVSAYSTMYQWILGGGLTFKLGQ